MELFLHIVILCRDKSNIYVFMSFNNDIATDENVNKVMQKYTKLGPTQLAILSTDLKKKHMKVGLLNSSSTARSSRTFWRPAIRNSQTFCC